MKFCFAAAITIGLTFGQTPSTTDKETPEHKAVRLRYELTQDRFAQRKKDYDARTDEANKVLVSSKATYSTPKEQLAEQLRLREQRLKLLKQTEPMAAELDRLNMELTTLEAQLKHVDDCTKAYQTTIDKKVSDLTTRESDTIKACKALDLYPFQK